MPLVCWQTMHQRPTIFSRWASEAAIGARRVDASDRLQRPAAAASCARAACAAPAVRRGAAASCAAAGRASCRARALALLGRARPAGSRRPTRTRRSARRRPRRACGAAGRRGCRPCACAPAARKPHTSRSSSSLVNTRTGSAARWTSSANSFADRSIRRLADVHLARRVVDPQRADLGDAGAVARLAAAQQRGDASAQLGVAERLADRMHCGTHPPDEHCAAHVEAVQPCASASYRLRRSTATAACATAGETAASATGEQERCAPSAHSGQTQRRTTRCTEDTDGSREMVARSK